LTAKPLSEAALCLSEVPAHFNEELSKAVEEPAMQFRLDDVQYFSLSLAKMSSG